METLPLFPLNTVLFPGVPLPLHIFEERYKEMMAYCLTEDAPFGVVLIESGSEAGAAAVPCRIGTSARIARIEHLDEGRLNLIAAGERRFRILRLQSGRPYLMGQIEWLADADGGATPVELIEQVRTELGRYLDRMFELMDQKREAVELPGNAERLSFVTAAVLQVSLAEKQFLLEALGASDRLRAELDLLAREADVQETLRRLKPALGTAIPLDPARFRQRISLN
jgi:Lon protease-like protein